MKKILHSCNKKAVFGTLVLSFVLSGCIRESNSEDVYVDKPEELNAAVLEPVKQDFAEIKDRGTLRMITNYSTNTYFLHKGLEWGFEYELVKEFAREHDLALEIVISEPDESPYDLLNEGKGDLIAANYTITPEREQYINFTRPYNLVNQLVIFSDDIENPPETLEELAEREIPLTVRRNSSYYYRLQELKEEEGYDFIIRIVSDEMDTETLLSEVYEGRFEATVADDNMFQAMSNYREGLVEGPVISKHDEVAWAIRKNASDLESELNDFLFQHFKFSENKDHPPKRSTFLNVIRQRYFEGGPQIADYYMPVVNEDPRELISPYDEMIKETADSAGVDWLLVSAMAAQETKFNPDSQSWAGAVGIMQIIPRFSEVQDVEMLYDAKINLKEGVRILKEHLEHYAYMDSTNQWAFALATYNAGVGHMADARRIVMDENKDPNEWENVSSALLKLMQRKYYKDARYGYCRGIETVQYVKEIMNRYKTYESVVAHNERRSMQRSGPAVLGMFK